MEKILNRKVILDTLIKHETLTIDDLAKEKNLGLVPDMDQLAYLIIELTDGGYLKMLDGTDPATFTITDKGIKEGERINWGG